MTDLPVSPPTCPFHGQSKGASQSPIKAVSTPQTGGVSLDERRVYRIRDFPAVREVLGSEAVTQAGFKAEAPEGLGGLM